MGYREYICQKRGDLLSEQYPDHTEEVDIEYEGPEMHVGFNARYMLDILAHIDTANTFLKFGETNTPIILTDDDSDIALFILMPMRI